MDGDRKLAWAIFISLGCHALILVIAVEFAPWRMLKAGDKSPIVVQLHDLSSKRATGESRGTIPRQKTAPDRPEPIEAAVTSKGGLAKKKKIEPFHEAEPATQPDSQNSPAADQVLARDRDVGKPLAEPQNEGAGHWHSEYALQLREMIREHQRYPIMATRNRLEGTVMIGFVLHRSGALIECHVTQSCRHEILDRAALRAVKSVKRFPPFPDSVRWEQAGFVVPVTFRIEN